MATGRGTAWTSGYGWSKPADGRFGDLSVFIAEGGIFPPTAMGDGHATARCGVRLNPCTKGPALVQVRKLEGEGGPQAAAGGARPGGWRRMLGRGTSVLGHRAAHSSRRRGSESCAAAGDRSVPCPKRQTAQEGSWGSAVELGWLCAHVWAPGACSQACHSGICPTSPKANTSRLSRPVSSCCLGVAVVERPGTAQRGDSRGWVSSRHPVSQGCGSLV